MAKQISIDEPVILETGTGSIAYLTAKMNNKTVGIPILSSSNNNVALIQPTVNMRLHNSTLYTSEDVTPYKDAEGRPLGLAVLIRKKIYAIPIYQVPENTLDTITLNFNETTTCIPTEAHRSKKGVPLSLIISINDVNYGIPLFQFDNFVNIQNGKTWSFESVKPKWYDEPDPFESWKPTEEEKYDDDQDEPNLREDWEYRRHDFAKQLPPLDPYGLVKPTPKFPMGRLPNIPEDRRTELRKLVRTMISVGKPTVDFGSDFGSTFLNNKITAYSDLINRIKMQFGWPTVEIDLCDENIAEFIDQAIERYTKFCGYTDEYLIFSTKLYKPGVGIRLDKLFSMTPEMRNKSSEGNEIDFDYDIQNYRKVVNCFSLEPGQSSGINTLFTLEQALAQQTMWSYLLGAGNGFDLTTWTCVKSYIDTRRKVLAQEPYFRFDPQTQYLRILPEPRRHESYLGLIGCYVEKPIRELINEPWIYEYTMALTLVAIGRLRSKYTFQMLGGATITGDQLLSKGEEQKKELEEQLFKGVGWAEGQPMFFVN